MQQGWAWARAGGKGVVCQAGRHPVLPGHGEPEWGLSVPTARYVCLGTQGKGLGKGVGVEPCWLGKGWWKGTRQGEGVGWGWGHQ